MQHLPFATKVNTPSQITKTFGCKMYLGSTKNKSHSYSSQLCTASKKKNRIQLSVNKYSVSFKLHTQISCTKATTLRIEVDQYRDLRCYENIEFT